MPNNIIPICSKNACRLCQRTQCPASWRITHSNSSLLNELYNPSERTILGQNGNPAIMQYIFLSWNMVISKRVNPVFFFTVDLIHLSSIELVLYLGPTM